MRRKLKRPVRNSSGRLRKHKLPKKTSRGRKVDRKRKSGEYHEVRYRRKKRK